jgi:hypothetical protein
MRRNLLAPIITAGSFVLGPALLAGPTTLPLRLESTCIYNGTTCNSIETTYGANLTSLPFSGTTNYDFYSPGLAGPVVLANTDRGSGTIYMANNSSTDDFTVVGRMAFYDYDPGTGLETALVDTGNSGNTVIKHGGKATSFPLPKVNLPASKTLAAGHLLHVAVTITLVSGNPDSFGQLLYNGDQTTSTIALLPQNNVVAWNFAGPSTRLSFYCSADGCAHLSCPATPGQTYTVQATANLAAPAWTNLNSATVGPNGLYSFVDTDAASYPCRFYRLIGP